MIKEQKHSINKVILTVDTNNKKMAFQFKDNLSMFLKQEIFPYLETYFDNLVEDVSAEIIQIEKLNLDINVTNNHDFSTLKSDLKNQIKKKVDTQISKLIKEKSTTTLISVQESEIKSFFYFLEEGILPWWNEHQSKKVFNKNDLLKLVKNANFKNQFQQKIKNIAVQHRLINQFYNDELVILCKETFNHLKIEKAFVKVITTNKFRKLKNKERKSIWLIIFDYFNHNNLEKTIHRLVELIQEKKSQKAIVETELFTFETITLKLISIISNKPINKLTTINLKEKPQKELTQEDKINDLVNKEMVDKLSHFKEKEVLENDSLKKNIIVNNQLIQEEIKLKEIENFDIKETIESETKTLVDDKSKNVKVDKEKKIEKIDNKKIKGNKKRDVVSKKENQLINLDKKNNKIDKKQEVNEQNSRETIKINYLEKNKTFNNKQNKEEIVYTNRLDPNIKLPEAITKRLSKNEENFQEEFFENPKTTYYIKNAGLILIHPFLKQFFQNSNLLTEDGQLKDKELAVHLLHYIATKKENQLESNLIFEKFLCGIPIKKSIDRKIKISRKLKDQTEELLEAVLQNWDVLKDSSTDLLRFEFLQREGKLSLEKESPKIIIERKTQDILLDKISWNISICKIPWLTKLLFTDW